MGKEPIQHVDYDGIRGTLMIVLMMMLSSRVGSHKRPGIIFHDLRATSVQSTARLRGSKGLGREGNPQQSSDEVESTSLVLESHR